MDADNRDIERAQPEENGDYPESDAEPRVLRRVPRRLVRVHFQGPLPPPSVLRQYDEVAPNAAERILQMAERQAELRNDLERGDARRATLGLIAGVIVVLAALALFAYAFYLGQPLAGVAGLGFISVVSAFVYGTRRR